MSGLQKLLTDCEVAELLSLSVASIRRWRAMGIGPAWLKLGGSVRYNPVDIETWMSEQRSPVLVGESA